MWVLLEWNIYDIHHNTVTPWFLIPQKISRSGSFLFSIIMKTLPSQCVSVLTFKQKSFNRLKSTGPKYPLIFFLPFAIASSSCRLFIFPVTVFTWLSKGIKITLLHRKIISIIQFLAFSQALQFSSWGSTLGFHKWGMSRCQHSLDLKAVPRSPGHIYSLQSICLS